MSKCINVTDETFVDEVVNSDKPVLVDFWAEWCQPCRMLSPIVEEIATENSDIKVAKVDVDTNPQVSVKYGIRSIPTIAIFKKGQIVEQIMGAVPKSTLNEALVKHT